MNMSLRDIVVWLSEVDLPSLYSIWIWLITVPWWLAIFTVALTVFLFRLGWDLTFYVLNQLFDWTFEAGQRFAKWARRVRAYARKVCRFGSFVKARLFR